MDFGFIGPSYTSASLRADAQRSLNLYPEVIESGTGAARMVLYGTPGLVTHCTLPTAPVRGLWAGEGRLFAAAGTGVYEIFSGGSYSALSGSIQAGTTPVQMCANGNQLFIVAPNRMYIASPAIVSVGDARMGAFLDSYFIALDVPDGSDTSGVSSRRIRHSALLDGTVWEELDFAVKEGAPDSIVCILSDTTDLWLFGSQTTEVWRNNYSTSPDAFPWERDPGATLPYGNGAPWATVKLGTGIAWLAGNPDSGIFAVLAENYAPQRVSTHAVETAWSGYTSPATAEGFAYTDRGHHFWQITFPDDNATWVYDATTRLWHERAYLNGSTLQRHRARGHAYQFGKHFVGDYSTGAIYHMSLSAYTDAGAPIRRIRTAPHLQSELKEVTYHEFRLHAEAGVGLAPLLDWSNEGGATWVPQRAPGTPDGIGEYDTKFRWNRLGSSDDRVFRVTITGDKRVALVNAYLDATVGAF